MLFVTEPYHRLTKFISFESPENRKKKPVFNAIGWANLES